MHVYKLAKIIPYLRLTWVIAILVNLISKWGVGPIDDAIFFSLRILTAGVLLIFSAYCVITAIQELKNEKLIDAKFFEFFGLFFEVIVLLAGFYSLKTSFAQNMDVSAIFWLTLWQIGLVILIYVDVRRVFA